MEYEALYKLTHGLYVLGAVDTVQNRFVGSIVDAVMQVANKPWVIALSCMNGSYTKECIEKTKEFSLSVLGKNVNPQVFVNFAFQSSRHVDKWNAAEMETIGKLPYLKGSIARLKARVVEKIIFESNTLFVAEIVDCSSGEDIPPLTYHDYRIYFKEKVLAAMQAQKEKKMMEENKEDKHWVCTVCGYVYDGDIPFEELSEDWVCPLCGVGKELFEYR